MEVYGRYGYHKTIWGTPLLNDIQKHVALHGDSDHRSYFTITHYLVDKINLSTKFDIFVELWEVFVSFCVVALFYDAFVVKQMGQDQPWFESSSWHQYRIVAFLMYE